MSEEQPRRERPEERRDRRTPQEEAARKRRLAEVFGDVLPETTEDERSRDRREGEPRDGDEWLRRQVPPHHG